MLPLTLVTHLAAEPGLPGRGVYAPLTSAAPCPTVESNHEPPGFNRLSFRYTNEAKKVPRAAACHLQPLGRPPASRTQFLSDPNRVDYRLPRGRGFSGRAGPDYTKRRSLGFPPRLTCLLGLEPYFPLMRLSGRIRTCGAPESKSGGLTYCPTLRCCPRLTGRGPCSHAIEVGRGSGLQGLSLDPADVLYSKTLVPLFAACQVFSRTA